MKIIDKNGRLFGKISVIDVLVILVVVLLAAALGFKGNQTQTSGSASSIPITFQLQVSGVRSYIADALREGDLLYDLDRDSGGALGRVASIEILPATRMATFYDGTKAEVPVEDSVSLLLTIEGEGIISDNRYLVNRVYNLGVNTTRNYCTAYTQFTATVTAIQG